ncbi:MAG: VCBS repeat-containing protein [Cyclobacteriaceae bacterium]|nr:VCBS repeat-containing protein [Cyclobacteriaceae bacterium]
MKTAAISTIVLFVLCVVACKEKKEDTLFKLLDEDFTGIDFNNKIFESDSFNILTYEYIYNGGGVAAADFNNDSFIDLLFTGNQVSNRLYLGKGNMKFTDATQASGLFSESKWSSGVSVVDINNDGLLDVYVCATAHPSEELRKNMLFINKGIDSNGIPVFVDEAKAYGLDFNGHSITSAFFDYDKDGDLDVYILVNVKLNNVPTTFRAKIEDGSSANNDRLFRNEGNGKFTDVTLESGIRYEGFGLGLAIQDFNDDEWPDIYVSNDYLSNDILYLNNTNGTFTNATSQLLGHQSQFSMGNDVADINNDAQPDIITLDMLPENSERKKTTIGNKSYQNNINNDTYKYQYQYVRNMLQLNNGVKSGIKFSEVGQFSGVYQTEWSWSPLFADFDNDGYRDLVITNGFPKDITDKDFANYRAQLINIAPPGFLVDSIPIVKIPNYAFRNNGDLTFEDVSALWGLNQASFSNGAVFADLDNDGDLDYVVNNINGAAFVYENQLNKKTEPTASNFLRIEFDGPKHNLNGLGTKVYVYANGLLQYHEHYPYRGYLSSVEGTAHFGLGTSVSADSIKVIWPDGSEQILRSVPANQELIVHHQDATPKRAQPHSNNHLVTEASVESGIQYKHSQTDIIDFNIQRTIPHKFSQFGPALAVGDVNGDGRDDIYISGATNRSGQFFIQGGNGKFKAGQKINGSNEFTEESTALLFDFDNDGDQDLYLGKGGFELEEGTAYQPNLYINNKGNFMLSNGLLPEINISTSCVRAADFDRDGDLDLFIGGRVIPGKYPLPPRSYLLRNENGKYVDVTEAVCPQLVSLGLVTDAIWSDYDNDGTPDLIVVGELMSVTLLKNTSGKLSRINSGLDNYVGWWNSIVGADFDQDGDIDYVVGNLGLNNSYKVSDNRPMRVFAKDLDSNGSIEALMFCYSKMADGTEQLCPIHFWDELNQQSPRFRRQFTKYKHFSKSTWETLLSAEDKKDAYIKDVNYTASAYIENLGNGNFKLDALPVETQLAPVNGILATDINGDSWLDILLIGNDYGNEVFIGRHDALTGVALLNNKQGRFTVEQTSNSGFYVPNDAKALVQLSRPSGDLIVASQNQDSLKVFSNRQQISSVFKPEPLDEYAILSFKDGGKRKYEFYYGAGFHAQSTRNLNIPAQVVELVVFNSKGEGRKIVLKGI